MTPRRIGELANLALIAEVEATPKPGLVDREGRGAHRDMDIHTFYRSARALHPHFVRFAELGAEIRDIPTLFAALRSAGQAAEGDMFAATSGVNTHKGALFSLGLLCGCAGRLAADNRPATVERLCGMIADMTRGICAAEYRDLDNKARLTKGEQMYLAHGVTGVRGEAESGFRSVREIALPVFVRGIRDPDRALNDVLLETLIALMAGVADTNILSRHDMATALTVRRRAGEVLDRGCRMADIRALDRELTEGYISPGGSADLLAVTVFLYSLQEDLDICL